MRHLRIDRFRIAYVLLTLFLVAACGGGGGGGGGGSSPPPADTVPPTVSSTSPTAGSIGVSLDTVVRVTMSEALAASSVGAGTLTLNAQGAVVAGVVTLAGNVVVFTPNAPLAPSTNYTAVLSNSVSDLAGNRLVNAFTWSFTTAEDTTSPTVISLEPADNATNVSVNVSVSATLNEPIDPASVGGNAITVVAGGQPVGGSVSLTDSNRTIVFTPSAALAASTVHTATLSGTISDTSGNTLGGDTAWTFTTAGGGGSSAGPAGIVYASIESTTVLRHADINGLAIQDRGLLSDPAWLNVGFLSLKLSPDGNQVAAIVAVTNASDVGLFLIPTVGGVPTRIAGDGSFDIRDVSWSPDGNWLAYSADKEVSGKFELYVVSATGTGDTKINGVIPDTADVANDYQWSTDSAFVGYRAAQETPGVPELYVSARDGSSNVRISGQAPAAAGENVPFGWRWSPATNQVAYVTDLASNNADLLYVVNSDGTGTTALSVPAGTTSISEIQWFNDGSRLLYSASSGGFPRLHIAPMGGGARVDLTPLPAGRGVATGSRLSPDNSLVAYAADADTAGLHELFVVAPDGSGRLKISHDLSGQASGVQANLTQWTSTSGQVLYVAPDSITGTLQVFIVNSSGTNGTRITQVAPGALEGYRVSPDATQVFVGVQENVGKIFSFTLDGQASVEVSDSTGGTDAVSFLAADNSGITELIVID